MLAAACCWCGLSVTPLQQADAAPWMFQRSYYSHDNSQKNAVAIPRPFSRSAYRPALVGNNRGFAVRGGYRYNYIVLNSGRSTDITIIREDWVDWRP